MESQKNQIKKGVLLALFASIISGIAIFYSKISVGQVAPLILTSSRNLYVGLLFLLFILFSGKLSDIKKIKRNEIAPLLLVGLIGGALPFYLFFTGLQSVQAITANLIQKTLFIWVTILAIIFLKEKLNRWYFVSFFLIFIANFYFAKFTFSFSKGELMILAATLFWGAENVIAKKILKNVSSELLGFFRMGIGGGLLIFTSVFTGNGTIYLSLTLNQINIIFIGGTILFLYVFSWYKALKYAPASLVAMMLTFAVVVGNILNGSFAGVKFVSKDVYSSLLIVAAIITVLFLNTELPQILKLKSQNRKSNP